MTLTEKLIKTFKGRSFSLTDAYHELPNEPQHSIRARIYEGLGVKFKKLGRALYINAEENCVLIEGDGRDLSILDDESIDCIITDHPWEDPKANKGGTRNFATYDCFKYNALDFIEKARVLKEGSFLVECIPAENETNYEYLYQLKKMAEAAGFQYYAKVPWTKGSFVSNTGRKAKNTEDLMIFSKGEPRKLRIDAKKTKATGTTQYMKGTNGMLPTDFNVQAVPIKERIHKSEKPTLLFEQLLEYVTLPNEVVLDQFAGSGVVGEACKNKNRACILIEKAVENCKKIRDRLGLNVREKGGNLCVDSL